MSKSKWDGCRGSTYEIVDLGRPFVFLLPSHKLRTKRRGVTVEEELHHFLTAHFGAFTTTTVPYFGFWRNRRKQIVYDECRQYEVSFVGKNRISMLLKKLANITHVINEDCIYIKAGQYAALLSPKSPKK